VALELAGGRGLRFSPSRRARTEATVEGRGNASVADGYVGRCRCSGPSVGGTRRDATRGTQSWTLRSFVCGSGVGCDCGQSGWACGYKLDSQSRSRQTARRVFRQPGLGGNTYAGRRRSSGVGTPSSLRASAVWSIDYDRGGFVDVDPTASLFLTMRNSEVSASPADWLPLEDPQTSPD